MRGYLDTDLRTAHSTKSNTTFYRLYRNQNTWDISSAKNRSLDNGTIPFIAAFVDIA